MPGFCFTSTRTCSVGSGRWTRVWLTIVCRCKPAGTPNGTCGGPGSPIGVPDIGMPYCGPVTPAM